MYINIMNILDYTGACSEGITLKNKAVFVAITIAKIDLLNVTL